MEDSFISNSKIIEDFKSDGWVFIPSFFTYNNKVHSVFADEGSNRLVYVRLIYNLIYLQLIFFYLSRWNR